MIYDDLKVCNRALSLLRLNFINSLDEDSLEAKQCKLLYNLVKAEVLSSSIWKPCLKIITLNNVYNEKQIKKIDYQYEFVLPSDCLRIISVNNNNNYLRKGRLLYSDDNIIKLAYLSNVDVEDLPINLVYLIVLKLAIELSFSFNTDDSTQDKLRSIYELEMKKSMNIDSKEGIEIFDRGNLFESSWLSSRN